MSDDERPQWQVIKGGKDSHEVDLTEVSLVLDSSFRLLTHPSNPDAATFKRYAELIKNGYIPVDILNDGNRSVGGADAVGGMPAVTAELEYSQGDITSSLALDMASASLLSVTHRPLVAAMVAQAVWYVHASTQNPEISAIEASTRALRTSQAFLRQFENATEGLDEGYQYSPLLYPDFTDLHAYLNLGSKAYHTGLFDKDAFRIALVAEKVSHVDEVVEKEYLKARFDISLRNPVLARLAKSGDYADRELEEAVRSRNFPDELLKREVSEDDRNAAAVKIARAYVKVLGLSR